MVNGAAFHRKPVDALIGRRVSGQHSICGTRLYRQSAPFSWIAKKHSVEPSFLSDLQKNPLDDSWMHGIGHQIRRNSNTAHADPPGSGWRHGMLRRRCFAWACMQRCHARHSDRQAGQPFTTVAKRHVCSTANLACDIVHGSIPNWFAKLSSLVRRSVARTFISLADGGLFLQRCCSMLHGYAGMPSLADDMLLAETRPQVISHISRFDGREVVWPKSGGWSTSSASPARPSKTPPAIRAMLPRSERACGRRPSESKAQTSRQRSSRSSARLWRWCESVGTHRAPGCRVRLAGLRQHGRARATESPISKNKKTDVVLVDLTDPRSS